MNDPRESYYDELLFGGAKDVFWSLLNHALDNDMSFYQLEAYVYEKDMHREAALLNLRDYRNRLHCAVNKQFYKDDRHRKDAYGINAIFAVVDYKARHGIKEYQPSIDWAEELHEQSQINSL